MNDATKRHKALSILRDMDTDNLVALLDMAPSQMVPAPAMDDLRKMLIEEAENDPANAITSDDFFFGSVDPNITEPDYSPRFSVLRASQTAHDLSAWMGELTQEADRSRLRVEGPGKMTAAKPILEDSPEVEYLGKLYENDGSEPENASDDEGWL